MSEEDMELTERDRVTADIVTHLRAGITELQRRRRQERHRKGHVPIRWAVCLHARLLHGHGPWVWAATTSGGETVQLTGAMLARLSSTPTWPMGVREVVMCVEDPTGLLHEDEPARTLQALTISRQPWPVPPGATPVLMVVRSLHAADRGAERLYLFAPAPPEGWPR